MAAAAAVYRKRVAGHRVELWDDTTGMRCAVTRVRDEAVFAQLEIQSESDGRLWRCEPNRKVMPTSWWLAEEGSGRTTTFSQRVAPKLLNPLGRRLLSLERSWAAGPFHVVDVRRLGPGWLLGITASDWALVRGDTPVAAFGYARQPEERSEQAEAGAKRRVDGVERLANRQPGILAGLSELARSLGSHDRALTSLGPEHALEPAEALVLLLLFESLTEST